nr:hypothetical protein [Mycoplasmopsis bovis]
MKASETQQIYLRKIFHDASQKIIDSVTKTGKSIKSIVYIKFIVYNWSIGFNNIAKW